MSKLTTAELTDALSNTEDCRVDSGTEVIDDEAEPSSPQKEKKSVVGS